MSETFCWDQWSQQQSRILKVIRKNVREKMPGNFYWDQWSKKMYGTFCWDQWLSYLKKCMELFAKIDNLSKKFHACFYGYFSDHLQFFFLLQHLTGQVQRLILRVNNALHKVQVLGHKIVAVLRNEDALDVKRNAVSLLLRFHHIKRRALRDWKMDLNSN